MLTLLHGDALTKLAEIDSESVQCVVTSPPYFGLRDYGVAGQLGLERTPEEYTERLVEIFRDVRRVLRKDGSAWLNLGDSYAGSAQGWSKGKQHAGEKQKTNSGSLTYSPDSIYAKPPNYISSKQANGIKPKDLMGIPWMVAFALRADGWYLRSDIVWAKKNCMPESVKDRPTRAHEFIFLLTKSDRYYYDAAAIAEPITESSIERLGRGVSDEHKLIEGAPGQPPHSIHEARPNTNGGKKPPRFGGDKSAGLTPTYSGKPWSPQMLASGVSRDGLNRAQDRDPSAVMRNKRDVWVIATSPFPEAHFAVYPEELIMPCILAGTKAGDTVLDPFAGSGTTGKVAIELGRKAILIEPKDEYVEMIERRCKTTIGLPLAI